MEAKLAMIASLDSNQACGTNPKNPSRSSQDANTDGITRGQMYPVERTIRRWQSRLEDTDYIRIGRHTKTDAVDNSVELHARRLHDKNSGMIAWMNMRELIFAEVCDRPPGSRVDEGKELLADVRKCSFGDR
jgi:hypothetical protein